MAEGTIAIPLNINHKNVTPRAVGQGLSVKVNANIGTSSSYPDPEPELEKLAAAIAAGADSVMDLSTGDNIDASRRAIIGASTVMVGTVPIYQATVETIKKRGAVVEMTKEDLFEVIRQQAADGADFMTIHCGINKNVLDMLTGEGRVMDVVSRGGSFITAGCCTTAKKTRCTNTMTKFWTSAPSMMLPLVWAMVCVPAAWPMQATARSCRSF